MKLSEIRKANRVFVDQILNKIDGTEQVACILASLHQKTGKVTLHGHPEMVKQVMELIRSKPEDEVETV